MACSSCPQPVRRQTVTRTPGAASSAITATVRSRTAVDDLIKLYPDYNADVQMLSAKSYVVKLTRK